MKFPNNILNDFLPQSYNLSTKINLPDKMSGIYVLLTDNKLKNSLNKTNKSNIFEINDLKNKINILQNKAYHLRSESALLYLNRRRSAVDI